MTKQINDKANTNLTSTCSTNDLSLGQRFNKFIHNRQTWGFLVSIVVMAVIAIAFFYPDNFSGNDLRQHDMQQGIANGQEIKAFEQASGQQSRWTDSLFSGMPTFQISPSYPSDSLFKWFTTLYGLGLPSPSNLLFMMMLGFMILMIVLKVRWEYGLIGAVAWGFSTYFIIIIGAGHIWKFVTLAYIPPTIAGILLAYRGRYLAGAAMAAFFAMMQIASNHVQMTYYFGIVIAVMVIAFFVDALRHKALRRWSIATASLAIAAALALCANLPNLYHTSRYAKETMRGGSELTQAQGLSRDYITEYSYGIGETFTLLIPNVKGGATVDIKDGNMKLKSLSELPGAKYNYDEVSNYYLPQLPQYFGEPQMTNGPVYVGAIIFALFILGCIVVRGPMKWALLILTVLSIALSWGRNFMGLTDLFIDIVPMYGQFRTVESILVIAEFTIPLLAVLGLWTLLRDSSKRATFVVPFAISFGLTALLCLIGVISPAIYGLEDETSRQAAQMAPTLYNSIIDLRSHMVSADSLRSLLYLLGAAAAILLYIKTSFKAIYCGLIVGILVLADLYSVDKRYINHDSFHQTTVLEKLNQSEPIQPTAVDTELLKDTDGHYRVMDLDRFGSADPSYFHKMIGGYHAAKLGRYQDLIERHMTKFDSPSDYNVLNMLNARYIVYNGQIMENPDALGNAWFVNDIKYVDSAKAEMDALDSLNPATSAVADRQFHNILGDKSSPSPDDSITLTRYEPNHLIFNATTANDAIAVFSEIYFPWGWNATIDGKPTDIARVNYVLRALKVPAGSHKIEMVFDPASVHTTVTAATVAIVLIYLTVIAAVILHFIPLPSKRK
jgi:hypothetical protein